MIKTKDMTQEEISRFLSHPDYVPLFENGIDGGELVAFEFIGKPDDKVYDEMLAEAKIRNENKKVVEKEVWYEHESPEPYVESNGNLPPGYSDRDL